jgi:predicted alpha/beta-hydrolase family hydrolase
MTAARRRRLAVVAVGVVLAATAGVTAATESVRTVPSRPGVTQSFLLVRPTATPTATVVLFLGGDGMLGLASGRLQARGNFLVRNRARFAGHGLLMAVIDTPSDRPNGLDGFRASAAHADDVRAVIAALRAEAAVPVWLVGTSMGTVSAANAAGRLTTGGPDGLVLTSTVTRPGRERPESVGDVRLKDIRVPALVVHHRDDACRATPYRDTVALLGDLSATPRRELLTFEGGASPRSGPCEPRAAHGFFGLDAEVVAAIARWIAGGPSQ